MTPFVRIEVENVLIANSAKLGPVGNSNAFVAAARSDCSASSKALQNIRPLSIATTMHNKYIIFMRHGCFTGA
jgi:hypothetical protein